MHEDNLHHARSHGRLIRVSAVVLRDRCGRILAVRKRGTSRFMQPGGKPDPGESAVETGIRECTEELGLALAPQQLQHLGTFCAPAANEPDHLVQAEVLLSTVAVTGPVHPRAEIAEVRWVDPQDRLPREEYAPLFLAHILPALRERQASVCRD